jgi:hypothetical protein
MLGIPGSAPPHYTSVSIPARWDGAHRRFFAPGPLDATIIIPPTGPDDRDGALQALAILAELS